MTFNSAASSPNSRLKLIQKLKIILDFATPYRLPLTGAVISLFIAAAMVLGLGSGLRHLIDYGFAQKDPAILDYSLLLMGAAVILLGLASFGRSYCIGWVGGTRHD